LKQVNYCKKTKIWSIITNNAQKLIDSNEMKITKLLAIYLGTLALIACSNDEGTLQELPGSTITTPTSDNDSATLSWTEPTTNVDNSVLQPGEITKYRIYLSLDQNDLSTFIEIDAAVNPNSYTIEYDTNLIPSDTLVYVAMTAINDQGIESNFSEVISFNSN
jgi:hypothetical protein